MEVTIWCAQRSMTATATANSGLWLKGRVSPPHGVTADGPGSEFDGDGTFSGIRSVISTVVTSASGKWTVSPFMSNCLLSVRVHDVHGCPSYVDTVLKHPGSIS